jgi:hypothetical protein
MPYIPKKDWDKFFPHSKEEAGWVPPGGYPPTKPEPERLPTWWDKLTARFETFSRILSVLYWIAVLLILGGFILNEHFSHPDISWVGCIFGGGLLSLLIIIPLTLVMLPIQWFLNL